MAKPAKLAPKRVPESAVSPEPALAVPSRHPLARWLRPRMWFPDLFTLGLVAIFAAINTYVVINHVMWRDESHFWLIARHSESFAALIRQAGYEGHPVAWSFCCRFLYDIGLDSILDMKIFHVLVATGCVYLFARYSPFSRLVKALFAFSYYPFYEYGTLVHYYAIEIFFIFVACVVFTRPRRRPILFGVALALLAQTHAFGALIGVAMGAAYLFDIWWNRRVKPEKIRLVPLLIGFGIALFGLFLLYLQLRTPPDALHPSMLPRPGTFSIWLRDGIRDIWRGYFPIPMLMEHYWTSNLLDFWPWGQFAIGLGLFFAVLLLLAPRPTALIFYTLATVALVLAFCRLPTAVRHHGHLFIVLMVSSWIFYDSRRTNLPRFLRWRPLSFWADQQPAFLIAVLGVNVIVCLMACSHEQLIPFSGSLEAAEIIRQKAPPDIPIIGDCDYAAAAVGAYLDRPIYFACRSEYGTFVQQDTKRKLDPLPPAELAQRVNAFMSEKKSDVVLLLNYIPAIHGDQVQPLGIVTRSIEPDEIFAIYFIKYTGR